MSKSAQMFVNLPEGSALVAAVARQRALNDAAAADAQDRYERHLYAEAIAIADGTITAQPTAEHLRVLFRVLDAQIPNYIDPMPF